MPTEKQQNQRQRIATVVPVHHIFSLLLPTPILSTSQLPSMVMYKCSVKGEVFPLLLHSPASRSPYLLWRKGDVGGSVTHNLFLHPHILSKLNGHQIEKVSWRGACKNIMPVWGLVPKQWLVWPLVCLWPAWQSSYIWLGGHTWLHGCLPLLELLPCKQTLSTSSGPWTVQWDLFPQAEKLKKQPDFTYQTEGLAPRGAVGSPWRHLWGWSPWGASRGSILRLILDWWLMAPSLLGQPPVASSWQLLAEKWGHISHQA